MVPNMDKPRYDMIAVIKQAARRRKHALALRNKGMTVQQVADELGISKQKASQLLLRARREAGQS